MSSRLVFSDADMAAALANLFPRGRVWPVRDPDSQQGQVVAAMGKSWARFTADMGGLIADAFPGGQGTPVMMLPEWEKSLGLPDPCAGPQASLQRRQAQVYARFIDGGGQSAAYFVAFAASLGYAVTVEKFAPFQVGRCTAGMAVRGGKWINALAVHAQLNTVTYFRAGRSAAGDPLADWGNDVLECEIRSRAPAQSTVVFEYA